MKYLIGICAALICCALLSADARERTFQKTVTIQHVQNADMSPQSPDAPIDMQPASAYLSPPRETYSSPTQQANETFARSRTTEVFRQNRMQYVASYSNKQVCQCGCNKPGCNCSSNVAASMQSYGASFPTIVSTTTTITRHRR
jgi:hypothetical protein